MNSLVKKGVVVAVILLFIGLAFAPSINANVSKASFDSELVDSIRERLDQVEAREETVEIFRDGILVEYREKLISSLDEFQHIRQSTETTNLDNIILNYLILILKILTLPLFFILIYVNSFILILSYIFQDLGFTTLSEILIIICIYIAFILLSLLVWYISEN